MNNSIKEYCEELAKELLTTFVNEKYKDSKILDKPDIQSNDGTSFGVEVTECMSSYDGTAEAFARMYFNKSNTNEELEEKMSKMKLDCLILHDDSNSWRTFSSTQGMFDVTKKKKEIADCIKSKNIKKEEGYKLFNENSLFLFCKFSYNMCDIKDIVANIYDNYFDLIFFECTGVMFVYYKNNNKIISYNYSENDSYSKILDILKSKSSCFKQKKIKN